MVDNSNLRSAVISESPLLPSGYSFGLSGGLSSAPDVLRTPHVGNIRSLPILPPPLPQSINELGNGYDRYGYGIYGSANLGYGHSNYGGLGCGYGSHGGYGSFGYNRLGSANVISNNFEQRFIQLAEASSRPAFQSIESLVSTIGNIASMLDSTFFALTSSFRAILGVAANFERLRGVFAQFWSTLAIFRALNWIYRKISFWLRLSNCDPSSKVFKKAFDDAFNKTKSQQMESNIVKTPSPWPVLAFLSFILTAPYFVIKLIGTVTNTAQEEARNPSRWTAPIQTEAMYDFQSRTPSELSMRSGQAVQVAPREIQQTLGLLNTGWALATTNGQTSGIIPINYVKSPMQLSQEREPLKQEQSQFTNTTANVFSQPPQQHQQNFNVSVQQKSLETPYITAATEEGTFALS
ncbi:probable peroxisomal membrane protein PEX13 [Scaptodrosophila lebanonensis]|uniref:Peroxisomal membrane protein PEX13 n=1 Tax=Drosophila lebanonensis TaxID=7225 RepID=A0A6J2U2K0_DROLE|nr:probable peroxisomal membrane protein PEX13 [Scaptodrosophila lebanonensis]